MRIAVTGDLHFGVKDSDKIFQDSQFKFLKEALRHCIDNDIRNMIILGDVFDTRHSVNVLTLNRVINFFEREVPLGMTLWVILGNHDLYYKNSIEVNSIRVLRNIKNVKIIDAPIETEVGVMVPWITDYEQFRNEVIPKLGGRKRIFGHFDIKGVMMDKFNVSNNGFERQELFEHWQYIYSGHYHHHSVANEGQNRLTYIGSPYQLNRSEIEEKGFYILDTKTEELEFVKNESCIEYRKIVYPNMPKNPEEFIKGHIIDVDISWEDSKYMTKVTDFLDKVESYGPAYPVNPNYQRRTERASTELIDASKITMLNLAKKYIDDSEDIKNKSKVFDEFKKLYSRHSIQ